MKTALILLTLILASTANAKNTMADGGSNIGGGVNGSEYLSTWCRGQTSLLRNYQERSELKLDNTGDYNLANKILYNGMIEALKSYKGNQHSFLAKSLARGLEIARNLEATAGKNPERKGMVTNNILNKYYSFMINEVARNMDIGAYIPYMQSTHEQMDARMAHYEKSFVRYASAQLDWVLQNLITETRRGDKLVIVPIGDSKAFIKVAIILTKATAEDLESSLWANRFNCAIRDLTMLNDELTAYDQGNREVYENEKQAIERSSRKIQEIVNSLSLDSSCL